jgi:hypothetical protein
MTLEDSSLQAFPRKFYSHAFDVERGLFYVGLVQVRSPENGPA